MYGSMGWFGKKKDTAGDKFQGQVGAHYVEGLGTEEDPLPVARPIEAKVVAAAPPSKAPAATVTHTAGGNVSLMKSGNAQKPPPVQGLRRTPCSLSACPYCHQATRTRIRTYPNIFTWILCLVLLLLFWPVCWIPLVLDWTKQTDHFCTRCNNQVGSVRFAQDCCEKHRS